VESVTQERQSAIDGGHTMAVRLMQHLVVPTFVLDAERRVTIWNRACERLTGIRAAQMVGTRNHWQAFYTEERYCLADVLALNLSDRLKELYSAHAEPGEFGLGLRAENWCTMPKIGERRYLAVDAGPIFDDHGRLIAVVETLRDMTAQKLAEMALHNLATQDSLTGVANRRALDERLQLEWARNQRTATPVSFMLADVDHFKRYNDHYGHQQGDDCLRAVAAAIKGAVYRPADLPARYGGEEFAIIMPGTDLAGAQAVAERVCQAVREQAIPHADSNVADCVTLSIGVATAVPGPDSTIADLVTAADTALYSAKRSGRNRCCIAAA
jgi:diguanylate cyclase (GGDEF)-like protein/PAS domain S-box-containing protein